MVEVRVQCAILLVIPMAFILDAVFADGCQIGLFSGQHNALNAGH